jgi:hypothetical protein
VLSYPYALLRADDDNGAPFENGGSGLVIVESALSTDQVNVQPLYFTANQPEWDGRGPIANAPSRQACRALPENLVTLST